MKTEDIEKLDMSAEEALAAVPKLVKGNQNYKHKTRMLQQKCRRLQQHVTSLKEIISQTRDKNMLSQPAAEHINVVS